MAEIARRATMWATMEPDCYGGKTCDRVVPRWKCYADGDKDSDYDHKSLTLSPKTFPPGTEIVIREPTCPECGELREPLHLTGRNGFKPKCRCGFDWNDWVLSQYS